jgi:hypothetical protein
MLGEMPPLASVVALPSSVVFASVSAERFWVSRPTSTLPYIVTELCAAAMPETSASAATAINLFFIRYSSV